MIVNFFGKRLLAIAGSLVMAAQSASAYDLAQEFSIANNPNGGWSYGYQSELGGSFNLLPVAVVNESNFPGWNHWRTEADAFLGVYKNTGATNITGNGSLIPVGDVVLHPGGNSELAMARWTAPGPGFWRVVGRFTGDDLTTTDVHVWLGAAARFDDTVTGLGNTKAFDFTINTTVGDTLDFMVGNGGNGFAQDSTSLSVTLVNAVILTIEREGDNIVLRWPAAAVSFILELNSSPEFHSGWSQAPETPVSEGGFWKITRPIGPDHEMFRLRYQEENAS